MLTEKAVTTYNFQTAIVVPCYNTGKYKLTECIQSILAQTYRQFILILVDDDPQMTVDMCVTILRKEILESR